MLADDAIGGFDVEILHNEPEHKVRRKLAQFFADRNRDDLCCYSGAFSRGAMARAGDGVELAERFDGQGQVVITASNAWSTPSRATS